MRRICLWVLRASKPTVASDGRRRIDWTRRGSLTPEETRATFFTELHGFQGQTVIHRWEWNGQVVAEVPFQVNGPRWRVHSTKQLLPEWVGPLSVSVVDASGQEIARRSVERSAPIPASEDGPASVGLDPQPPAAAEPAMDPVMEPVGAPE